MYRRPRLPLPLVAGAIGIGVMSGSFIFAPALSDYWAHQPLQPPSSSEVAAPPSAHTSAPSSPTPLNPKP
ncbi:unnamed protein product [Sphagnum troendelagicum]|uniref:Uncharacterized protein n=1 Tax=Sphagnum troendelagicum TaxID=128251 RepID=A0ABP0TIU2_9BRYO